MKRTAIKFVALFSILLSGLSQATTEVTFYHNDHLGSPVMLSNDQGGVVAQESYRPFGERIDNDPDADANDVWYTGKVEDEDTGLNYLLARQYDSHAGRFYSIDPVGFVETNPISINRYAYANNNPYTYIDPDGKYAELPLEFASIGIGVKELADSVNEGDYLNAGIYTAAVAVDFWLALLPGAPGVASATLYSARHAPEAIESAITSSARALPAPTHVPNAGGQIVSDVTKSDEIFYRVYSGDSTTGAFLTRVPPTNRAQAVEGLALPPSNTAEFIQQVTVPAGTRLQRSRALPAFGRRGGREQFELIDQIPNENFGPGVPLP